MKSQNIKFEESVQDEQISKMLGGLKRVDAPGDFNFRVTGRIAAGQPSKKAAWWANPARLAVPLVLLFLVGGYFGFNAIYSTDKIGVSPVAEIQPTNFTPDQPVAPRDDSVVIPQNEIAVVGTDPKPPGAAEKPVIVLPRKDVRPDNPGGGSRVEALSESRKIYPKGVNPDPVGIKALGTGSQLKVKDLLEIIGVKAVFSRSGWRVDAVTENNIAARSGVKTGDVIEAINDQRLKEKTSFGNRFTGKSLNVLRDGKSLHIELKP
jgi:hypothetical protein